MKSKLNVLRSYIRQEIREALNEKIYADPKRAKDPNYIKSLQTSNPGQEIVAEMAKIEGELEKVIKQVILDNPELSGLALKKAIRADEDVMQALKRGPELFDNQLNRFIAKVKGEGEPASKANKSEPDSTPHESEKTHKSVSNPTPHKSTKTHTSVKKSKVEEPIDMENDPVAKLVMIQQEMKALAQDYKAAEAEGNVEKVTRIKKELIAKTKEKKALEKIVNDEEDFDFSEEF